MLDSVNSLLNLAVLLSWESYRGSWCRKSRGEERSLRNNFKCRGICKKREADRFNSIWTYWTRHAKHKCSKHLLTSHTLQPTQSPTTSRPLTTTANKSHLTIITYKVVNFSPNLPRFLTNPFPNNSRHNPSSYYLLKRLNSNAFKIVFINR